MKFNYKKIASVLASAVMLSSTIGFAAAANYPAPFVTNGVGTGAIVYGSASAASIDMTNAVDLQTDLNNKITSTGGTATPTGGESYSLAKPSTKFHLGNGITDVVSSSVTDDNLPTLLKDGVFTDTDNSDYKYTQKLTLSNLSYTYFSDSDFKDSAPAMGIKISSNAKILNYTLDFSEQPYWSKLATKELTMMGKDYYILSNTSNTALTLLDSAEKALIAEGDTKTITVNGKSYEVKVSFVSSSAARLEINREVTNSLAIGGTQKLSDGSFVGIRDILYNSKDTGISNVEFSIGSGKLKITNGSEVELNDDSIDGLTGYLTSASSNTKLSQIQLVWTAGDDLFVADGSTASIPGFNSIKLSYGGMTVPANEQIAIKNDGSRTMELVNFPLKDSTETIPIIYGNSSGLITGIGKDSTHVLRTGTTAITFNTDTDENFVASWSDGKDAESYLMRVSTINTVNSIDKATIQYRKNSAWVDAKVDANQSDTVTVGNVEITVGAINKSSKTVALSVSGNNNFNTLYSKEGMKVYLPYTGVADQNTAAAGLINFTATANVSALGHNGTSFYVVMSEEDQTGNKGAGKNLTTTIAFTSDAKIQVSAVSGGSLSSNLDTTTDEQYTNAIYSALATSYIYNQAPDQDTLTVTYNGDESYGNFYITAYTTSIASAGSIKFVTDQEVQSVKDLNLIVVGGSCVNSVAAKLLESDTPLCGEAFTAKTTVPASKYIIKTYNSPYTSGKVATLVAGYNADDTKNALTRLMTGVKTDVDSSEIGPALS